MSKSASRRARRQQQDRMMVIAVAVGVVIVFGLVIVLLLGPLNPTTSQPISSGATTYRDIPQTFTSDGAPVIGAPNAKITLVEFSDFSCTHCADYHATMNAVIEQLVRPGKVRLMVRPLTFVGGEYSQVAAVAALCAGKQNGFFDMQNVLYTIQRTTSIRSFELETLKQRAAELGLDANKLGQCMISGEVTAALTVNNQRASDYGVSGTPSVLYSTDGTTFQWISSPQQSAPDLASIVNLVNQNK